MDTGNLLAAPWEEYSVDLSEARSDHACSLVQHGWRRGILVAGGYRTDGAWMSTVEFVDLERGERPSLRVGRLKKGPSEGRDT